MTGSILDLQSELPRSIPLFRYAPERVPFLWKDFDPSNVSSTEDLPQYLILGHLDSSSFQRSSNGWYARWQGTEDETHFEVTYKADTNRWEIRQTWCGQEGGFSLFPANMPLDRVITQGLYTQFPSNWDTSAKAQLETAYQLTVIEQPENEYSFCFIPDGAFRTIIFPIAVRNIRPVRQWIEDIVKGSPLTYPISVEAKIIFQALNYLEGKAPEWTTQEVVAFNHAVTETGLAPYGYPVREEANDGSAAWTLRREIYFLFIQLPFAGLTDFLDRMLSENGPVRSAFHPDLRYELRPIIIPAGFEMQTESATFWDDARTTRSFLQFRMNEENQSVSTVEEFIETEKNALDMLAKAESISSNVVSAIDQIFQQATQGNDS